MKSEQSAMPMAPALSGEAFQAFFEALETPAALCAADFTVLALNPAFEILCGVKDALGKRLGDLLEGVAEAMPAQGGAADVEITLRSGQSVTLTLSRRGEILAVLARDWALGNAGRALIQQGRVEQTLLELGRDVAGATSEEELVAVVARGVKGLFPGRTFCVRISDPRSSQLTSLYAEGRLRDHATDVMVIRHRAAEKTHLSMDSLPSERVKITDDEVPLMFVGSVRAICAPLVASGQLFGVLNVEYPEGMTADLITDDRLLIQLANQVSVGIRNAKLIDELTFVRKYLEELLEHANALILVANQDRRVVVFNRALSQLTGLSQAEVLGQDLLSLIPESERLRVVRVVTAALRGEQVSNFETRVIGHNGREARVSFATSSVVTARGEVEGVIAIGHDLTEVKELERRVIQAEKLASLGQLAASVVHEINNPMTAVAAYAEALMQKFASAPDGDRADQEKLRKILENAQRILRFTRDLISYARPATDRAEEVDVHQVLEMALGFCDHVVRQHGVTVTREYQPVSKISAVKGNLVQVFVNLITNACHAMQPGGTLVLGTFTTDREVVIRVSDTGSGIQPQHLERIWEPFFTTKPDGKGTGLGLSIVQSIVEKHGGQLAVESAPNAGTTFKIQLPMLE